jgi:hypothetical protein
VRVRLFHMAAVLPVFGRVRFAGRGAVNGGTGWAVCGAWGQRQTGGRAAGKGGSGVAALRRMAEAVALCPGERLAEELGVAADLAAEQLGLPQAAILRLLGRDPGPACRRWYSVAERRRLAVCLLGQRPCGCLWCRSRCRQCGYTGVLPPLAAEPQPAGLVPRRRRP